MLDPMDYIGTFNSLSQSFVKQVSDNTGEWYHDLWIENARANRNRIRKEGWACSELQGKYKDKTTVMLGAGPSINKHLDQLRELQKDDNFVFVSVHSGVAHMLNNGITPHYCTIADADPTVKRFWSDLDMSLTKNTTLIACINVHPSLIELWQGPILWIVYYTGIKKIEKKYRKWFDINGCGQFFISLCSQYNSGTAFAYLVFETPIIIFVGNELSFKDEGIQYYADKPDLKDTWKRKPAPDIYGNKVYTTYVLYSLKLALEDFLGKVSGAGWFFNCSEEGIFGVSNKHGMLPWIQQLPLEYGIAQAKHIMLTGKPLTLHYPGADLRMPKFVTGGILQ